MRTDVTLLSLTTLCAIGWPAVAQDSELYLSGLDGKIRVMRFGDKQREFPAIGGNHQYGLAVADDVRTIHMTGTQAGGKYSLSGAYQNVSYYPNFPTTDGVYDGTTDGTTYNWAPSFNDGKVYRFDRNWGNITTAFTVGVSISGITYDLVHQSLWLYSNNTSTISEYSTTGQLLSTFSTGVIRQNVSLAYEPSTQTIWTHYWHENVLNQYSRSGDLLRSVTFFGPDLPNCPSMEFSMTVAPAPGALGLLGTAGLAAFRRRRA